MDVVGSTQWEEKASDRFREGRDSRSAIKRARSDLWFALCRGEAKEALKYVATGYTFESMVKAAESSPAAFRLLFDQYQPNPEEDDGLLCALAVYHKPSLLGMVFEYIEPSPAALAFAFSHGGGADFMAKLAPHVDIAKQRYAGGLNTLEVVIGRPPGDSWRWFSDHESLVARRSRRKRLLREILEESTPLIRKCLRAGLTIGEYASSHLDGSELREILAAAGASEAVLDQAERAAARDTEVSRWAEKIEQRDRSVFADSTSSQVAQRMVDRGVKPKATDVARVCRELNLTVMRGPTSPVLGSDVAWWFGRATEAVRKSLDNPLCCAADREEREHGYGVEVLALALESGLDPNATGYAAKGHTARFAESPLHRAARAGLSSVCEMLLAHGADVNAQNKGGSTPAHLAMERIGYDRWNDNGQRHIDVLSVLVANGADLSTTDDKGRSVEDLFNAIANADKRQAVQEVLNRRQRDSLQDLLAGMGIDRPKRARGGL